MAYLSVIPGLALASPMDEGTLRSLMYSSLSYDGPLAIRYPRGEAVNVEWKTPFTRIETGRGRALSEPRHKGGVAILSIGPAGNDVRQAVAQLASEGVEAAHFDMIWLKPIDTALLEQVAREYSAIVTVEDASVKGGLGSAVVEWLAGRGISIPVRKLGVPAEQWVHHGSVAQLRHSCGYDVQGIAGAVRELAAGISKKGSKDA